MNNECNWIKQKYEGVLEIYPTRCLNSQVLDAKLMELSNNGYNLIKVLPDWIRAFKTE